MMARFGMVALVLTALVLGFSGPAAHAGIAEWLAQAQATPGNVVADGAGYTFTGTGVAYSYGNLDEDSDPASIGAGGAIEYMFNAADSGSAVALGKYEGWNGEDTVLKLEQWNNTGRYGITIPGVGDWQFTGAPSTFSVDTHVVFNGRADGEIEIYVNGESKGLAERGAWVINGDMPGQTNYLGSALDPTHDPVQGKIYGVGTYDRELTLAEITALYDEYQAAGPPPPTYDPVFLYRFPESWDGAGTAIVDQSLAGNDGSIISGTVALSPNVPAGEPASARSLDFLGDNTVGTNATDLLDNPLVEASGGFRMDTWFLPTAADMSGLRKLIDYAGTEAIMLRDGSLVAYISDSVALTHSGVVTPDEWNHAVLVFDIGGHTIDPNGDIFGDVLLTLNGVEEIAGTILLTDFGDSLDRAIGVGSHPFGLDNFGGLLYDPSVNLGIAAGPPDVIPEPATLSLLALGGLAVWRRRKARR